MAGKKRIGVYRIEGWEATCSACLWYGTPGLHREEANDELKQHRATPRHKESMKAVRDGR